MMTMTIIIITIIIIIIIIITIIIIIIFIIIIIIVIKNPGVRPIGGQFHKSSKSGWRMIPRVEGV